MLLYKNDQTKTQILFDGNYRLIIYFQQSFTIFHSIHIERETEGKKQNDLILDIR